MKKSYVSELTKGSKALFESLANEQGFRQHKSNDYLNGEIEALEEVKVALGFRFCDNSEYHKIYNEGFQTKDGASFCSSECAENTVTDICEEDYGDFIFYTD